MNYRALLLPLSLSLSLLASCDSGSGVTHGDSVPIPKVMLRLTTVQDSDAKGVAVAECPLQSRLTGGGCQCESAGAHVFSSHPVQGGNAYICSCYGTDPAKMGATAYATCLEGQGMDFVKVDVASLKRARLRALEAIEHPDRAMPSE